MTEVGLLTSSFRGSETESRNLLATYPVVIDRKVPFGVRILGPSEPRPHSGPFSSIKNEVKFLTRKFKLKMS